MHGANQMGLGPDFGNGFGGFGSPEGMAENAVAAGTMSEAEAYGSFDTPGNVDGGGATPVMNITPGMPISPQINSFVNALKTAMSFSPMQQAMKWGMSMMPEQMRAPTMNFNAMDPLAMNAPITSPYANPHEDITTVAMAGSGAHMAPATSIENWGGQDVHVGPPMQMNEDFFPGYGTNPYSGVAMADPGDPYIRQRRGTEIAGMI